MTIMHIYDDDSDDNDDNYDDLTSSKMMTGGKKTGALGVHADDTLLLH